MPDAEPAGLERRQKSKNAKPCDTKQHSRCDEFHDNCECFHARYSTKPNATALIDTFCPSIDIFDTGFHRVENPPAKGGIFDNAK
jgi:hypothetical protein